jgi:polysaccharide export outer membrane protein
MKRWLLPLAAMAIFLSAPVRAQEFASNANSAIAVAPPQPGATPAVDYSIGPLDTLQIDVFDVPDLSRTVQVDNSGFVVFPLIGQVPASGRSPNQLSQDIAAELQKKYLKDPIVTVIVKDPASQKITVDGSVILPGVYEIEPHTTLMQAVALAKGPDTVADTHHVTIIRVTAEGQQTTVFDLEDIRDGNAVDPFVHARDVIVVDVSGTRRFVRDYGSLIGLAAMLHP